MTLATAARTLPDDQRSKYERAVLEGRAVAERAVDAALNALTPLPNAIQHTLTAFGGEWSRLVEEAAYTQWHRVLFARFLIENDLLMNEDGVPFSLADCAEQAQDENAGEDAWDIASRYASAMLPGIFRPGDALAELRLAAEHRAEMQRIVAEMPKIIFTTSDSLGWSYQYWQKHRKDAVNRSEVKIGGAELPAVTQLFTEPYMVDFLVHNTLGAWWATRHPDSPLVAQMEYLRRDENGTPYGGTFDEWPDTVAEVTAIDPCCGSGHFLTTIFHWLRLMRQEEEGLAAADAGDAVLRDNLFGLELDARCIQIAYFNLAMHAWLEGGYRSLPEMNLACTGIPVKGTLGDWLLLAKGDERIEEALTKLHKLLENAEHLGSLINPNREVGGDLLTASLEEVMPVLGQALAAGAETLEEDVYGTDVLDAWKAVRLLAGQYWLVLTNVPYLGRGKMNVALQAFIEKRYDAAKADLATAMLVRCRELAVSRGVVGAVSPRHWLDLRTLEAFRRDLLPRTRPSLIAALGSRAFSSISGEVVNVTLSILHKRRDDRQLWAIDCAGFADIVLKSAELANGRLSPVNTHANFEGWVFDPRSGSHGADARPLGDIATVFEGTSRGDTAQFDRCFWELPRLDYDKWWRLIDSPAETSPSGVGRQTVYRWDRGKGALAAHPSYRPQGMRAWGAEAVVISRTRLTATLSNGHHFAQNCVALLPQPNVSIEDLWSACSSEEFRQYIRVLSQKLVVPTGVFERVMVGPGATPGSNQLNAQHEAIDSWDFNGHPASSDHPLHVAIARLLGYRWPAQFSEGDPIPDKLDPFADADGIVCLPSVSGELPAAERLRSLLAAAYGDNWNDARQNELLAQVEHAGKSLNDWLRAKKGFAAQHSKLFHNRPFIWQISDGAKDGFSALVNYHKLDRANLDRLIHTYLQDWINTQRSAMDSGERGADARLAKALELKVKLEAIAEGKPPYDIYVRWKRDHYLSLTEPPSWDPDLDDGVRMNIRPFVKAGVLHAAPNVNWKKDRGKDPDGSERHNDLHFGAYEVPET